MKAPGPVVASDERSIHLEWVVDGRTFYLTFYDNGSYEVFFADGQDEWEAEGYTSLRFAEGFRRLFRRGTS